jgi:SAM-dependent methyltransferase
MRKVAVAFILRLFFFVPAYVLRLLYFEMRSTIFRALSSPLVLDPVGQHHLNLGSGPCVVKGLTNVDFFGTPGIDYGADLRFPLKISDEVIDGIFSEHTLEHLSYVECRRLLAECHRILKPEGVIRIVVPDLSIFIRNYADDNKDWFATWEQLLFLGSSDSERAKRRLTSPLEAISFVTQEYGHRSSWDFVTLKAYLEHAGFRNVMQTAFRQGQCEKLLIDLDDNERKFVSLYVEAVK